MPYWQGMVEEIRPRRVLELGCGTGRLTFPMATAGLAARPEFQLIGLDRSVAFLDRARARVISSYPALAGAVRFVEADMASFSFPERFDLIVLAYNNLSYLVCPEQRVSCFQAVRRHLAEGGRFAIDLAMPDLGLLAEAQRAVFPTVRQELEWKDPAPGVSRFVSFFKTTSYDAATQTEETTHYWEIYHADGRHSSMVKELTWHHFFPCELRNLLLGCGLVPVAEYGDYDRTPFSGASSSFRWVMAPA